MDPIKPIKPRRMAHVCVKLRNRAGDPQPEFVGLGIYSESARSLTVLANEIYAELFCMEAESFQEARDLAVNHILSSSDLEWAHPWVDSGTNARMVRCYFANRKNEPLIFNHYLEKWKTERAAKKAEKSAKDLLNRG